MGMFATGGVLRRWAMMTTAPLCRGSGFSAMIPSKETVCLAVVAPLRLMSSLRVEPCGKAIFFGADPGPDECDHNLRFLPQTDPG